MAVVEAFARTTYLADGQTRDVEEPYNYTPFRQSRMFAAGVTCSDCREPHRSKLRLSGDGVCLQCHGSGKFGVTAVLVVAISRTARGTTAVDTPCIRHHRPAIIGARTCMAPPIGSWLRNGALYHVSRLIGSPEQSRARLYRVPSSVFMYRPI